MELSLVFTTLGSDPLNKGNEHKRRDWVFNVAAKEEPKDDWIIICKIPITILKEVTGKTRISKQPRREEVHTNTIRREREEAIERRLESIRRHLGELRTRTNTHLQKIQEMLDETLLQIQTHPPTIELNSALEDSKTNEAEVVELDRVKENSWFRQDEIDPRAMIEVIDELEHEQRKYQENSANNPVKIEQWLDWEVQCTDMIEEHREST